MTSSAAVIDSSLAILNVLDTPQSENASRVWELFQREQVSLLAPRLWRYEVTSVIHMYLFEKILEPDEAVAALQTAFELSVRMVDEDEALCRSAFQWADRLEVKAAYDCFYLALAERLGVDFWTVDQRLVNNVNQIGITWLHWMGEV